MEKKDAPAPPQLIEFYKFDPTSKVLFKTINSTPAGVPMQELLNSFFECGVMASRNMTNFKILIGQESGIIKWDVLKEFSIKFGPLFLCHEMVDDD
jgi:hypothetical protein